MRIGLDEPASTTKTLSGVSSPCRTHHLLGHRLTLHLPQGWPWQNRVNPALARLRALPLPS